MANVTYDLQWKESMVELLDQLEVLDPSALESIQEAVDAQDASEKFQHFATLYIRYLQIFRKVEESYDMMVHPQKRMDIKKVRRCPATPVRLGRSEAQRTRRSRPTLEPTPAGAAALTRLRAASAARVCVLRRRSRRSWAACSRSSAC